jgi:hypothetical protein
VLWRDPDWVRPDAGALCCVRLKPAISDDAAMAHFYEVLTGKRTHVANGVSTGVEY